MRDTSRKEPPAGVLYRFGLFVLDVDALALTRSGVQIRLQEQPLQLLAMLLEMSGEVVTRDELRQRLWPGNTFVDFDKSLGVAVLKVRDALGDSASNPTFIETLPRRGYRFIAPVSTEARFPVTRLTEQEGKNDSPSVTMLATEAATFPPPHAPSPQAPEVSTEHRILWAGLALVSVIVTVGFAVVHFHGLMRRPPSPHLAADASAATPKLRRSIAVLGFRNVAGNANQAWLSGAFTEMLNTELAAHGDLRLISGEEVANVKHDLSLTVEDTFSKDTLAQLRSDLGADVVVVGSYTLMSNDGRGRIRLDIRAQDTALGETISENAVTGEESDLFDIGSQAGNRLRESLDPALSLAPDRETRSFSGSTNSLAIQFYSEGRARSFDFDFVGARDFFRRSIAADASFALAHSALSEALERLGYGKDGRYEAKLAFQHANGLPTETKLAIEGAYQESLSDWVGAASTYRTLYNLYPDNLTYGLRLAAEQLHLSPSDAEQTLTSLRKLPAPVGVDPRIDLMEASVMIYQDIPKARAAAERAIAAASAEGSTLMVAHGYGVLCQQDASLTESVEQSVSECTLARNSYMAGGDQNNAARTLNDLAGIYFLRGELDQAEKMWRDAINVFRAVGDEEGLAAASNNVGDVFLTRGKLEEAHTLLLQAIAGYMAIGDRSGVALAKADLGQIELHRANLSGAQANDEQAFAVGMQAGDKSATAYGLSGLGDVLTERDQIPAAREKYQAALKLRNQIGEEETVLQSRLSLARLDIEQGHAVDAERDTRSCREQFHAARLLDDEIEASLMLTNAFLRQMKIDEANDEMAALRPLEEKTQNHWLKLRFALEKGEILLTKHDLHSARPVIEMALSETKSSGYVEIAEEARLLLARMRSQSGDTAEAAKQLGVLEAQAKREGLLLLARKVNDVLADADRSAKPPPTIR